MPQTAYRYGALYVSEDAQDFRVIDLALKQLDTRLFLERQINLDNVPVWTVQLDVGDQVPVWVLDWVDDDDTPISEPTFGLVEQIKAMQQRGPVNSADHRRRNEELREARRQEARDEMREMILDYAKAGRTKSFHMAKRDVDLNHARHARREARLQASDRLVA